MIRARGYSATSVDDLCRAADVTKGGFFHHFKSKEDLAIAAAGHFSTMAEGLFSTAPYRALEDPLDRLLGYIDFRRAILKGALPDFTCLLGTMVQETYDSHPGICAACERGISAHAATVEADIAAAMAKYGVSGPWTAESLGLYTQAVLQGAFILAKAKQGPAIAEDCVDHLRRYIKMIFAARPLQQH